MTSHHAVQWERGGRDPRTVHGTCEPLDQHRASRDPARRACCSVEATESITSSTIREPLPTRLRCLVSDDALTENVLRVPIPTSELILDWTGHVVAIGAHVDRDAPDSLLQIEKQSVRTVAIQVVPV